MKPSISHEPASVPISSGEDVEVEPFDPWPSAYRGSEYSVIDSRKHGTVLAWKYEGLQSHLELPDGLEESLDRVNKSAGRGYGSIRITAGKEVLTKVHAQDYPHTERAPTDSGWIPAYVGQLQGTISSDQIPLSPPPDRADPIAVWEGFPFNHGETWTVNYENTLVWRWEDYEFESAFDHTELVETYNQFRKVPGRLYINENGRIWVNIVRSEVPDEHSDEIDRMYQNWKSNAKRENKNASLRLVTRRLESTGEGNTADGCLPVYLGHVSEFDEGAIPRPVVDDMRYFRDSGSDRGA